MENRRRVFLARLGMLQRNREKEFDSIIESAHEVQRKGMQFHTSMEGSNGEQSDQFLRQELQVRTFRFRACFYIIQDFGDIPDRHIFVNDWLRVANSPNQERGILTLSH